MSTSLLYHALGIRGYGHRKTCYVKGATEFVIEHDPANLRCARCGSADVMGAGKVERRFRDLPIGKRPTWIVLDVQRLRCRKCHTVRQARLTFADHPRLRALCTGTLPPDHHPGCRPSPEHQLGHRQGYSEASPPAALQTHQTRAPETDRHRRDQHRQGASLCDPRAGPGKRRGGVHRQGKKR